LQPALEDLWYNNSSRKSIKDRTANQMMERNFFDYDIRQQIVLTLVFDTEIQRERERHRERHR
jgi:hypothetical protein